MKVVLAKSGPPVSAPPLLRAALSLDLLVSVACVVVGVAEALGVTSLAIGRNAGIGLAAYGVLAGVTDVAAARVAAKGITWRRRLGYAAIVAVLWRGSPFSRAEVAVPAVLWTGFVWVSLVVAGRTLSRAIASVTGEDKPE